MEIKIKVRLALSITMLLVSVFAFTVPVEAANRMDRDFVQLFSQNAHGRYSWTDLETPGLTGNVLMGKFIGDGLQNNTSYLLLVNRIIELGEFTTNNMGFARVEFPSQAIHLNLTNVEIVCVPSDNFVSGTLTPSSSDTYLLPSRLVNFP